MDYRNVVRLFSYYVSYFRKAMKKVLLFNLLCFVVLMALFLAAAFAMGYAGGKRFGSDAGILYLLVTTLHLFANYTFMHRKTAFTGRQIGYASAVILCLYTLVLLH